MRIWKVYACYKNSLSVFGMEMSFIRELSGTEVTVNGSKKQNKNTHKKNNSMAERLSLVK